MSEDATESARRLAEQHGLRYVDLSQSALAPGAAALLPEQVARQLRAVPIGRRLGTPVVAVADPSDLSVMDSLRTSIGREFVAVVARADQVDRAIDQLYQGAGDAEQQAPGFVPSAETQAQPEQYQSSVAVAEEATGTGLPGAPGSIPATPAFGQAIPGGGIPQAQNGTGYPGANGDANGHVNGYAASGTISLDDAIAGISAGRTAEPAAGTPLAWGSAPSAPDGGLTFTPMPPTPGIPTYDAPPSGYSSGGSIIGSLEESLKGILGGASASAPPPIESYDTGVLAPAIPSIPSIPSVPSVGTPTEAPPPFVSDPAEPGMSATAVSAAPPLQDAPGSEAQDMPPPIPATGVPPAADFVPQADVSPEVAAVIAQGPPLARVLVEAGRVSAEDMARAIYEHPQTGESLARFLYNRHMATEDDLVRAMAMEVGLEYVDLNDFPIDARAVSLIPDAVARHHMVLPIRIEDGVPIVAMANPTDVFAMDDLRTIMGRNFTPVVASRSQIANQLRLAQGSDSDVDTLAQEATTGAVGSSFELENLTSVVEDAPIVRYVNLLILQALNERASDIHIEPTPKRMLIRFRIDGVMHDATSAAPTIHQSVVSRLKVLGEMDITEHRIPQDGRVSLAVGDRQIDLRMTTLPSLFGETCVMRLLDKSASIRSLPELGFFADTLDRYAEAYSQPYGVVLVTGPTGAGKTTTLYATLREVVSQEKSVVTVEDPVEYQIDGITQVPISTKSGLDLTKALRAILRADPDIILIGEIRDAETATIAMEAALSGHLVLSTLHTNSAAATPLRLTELGIEPFLVTSALSAVLTQRLARILCTQCKEPYEASIKDFLSAGYKEQDLDGLDTSTLYRASGCRRCSHTGYFGRVALGECLVTNEEIDRMIIEQESILDIERKAVEQGMRTLRNDGLRQALVGQTTLEEVLRVVV